MKSMGNNRKKNKWQKQNHYSHAMSMSSSYGYALMNCADTYNQIENWDEKKEDPPEWLLCHTKKQKCVHYRKPSHPRMRNTNFARNYMKWV